jgi:hypothetical protein
MKRQDIVEDKTIPTPRSSSNFHVKYRTVHFVYDKDYIGLANVKSLATPNSYSQQSKDIYLF